jgi:hypothetical protein
MPIEAAMREPRSWASEEPTSEAARLTALAASVEPRQANLNAWREVLTAAHARPPARWTSLLTFIAAMAVGALMTLGLLRAERSTLRVEPAQAQWKIENRTIRLDSGRLAIAQQVDIPFEIVTPHLVIAAGNCRVAAEVLATGTLVSVEAGEVQLRSGAQKWSLHAGQSVTWPPTPTIPGPLESSPDSSVCNGNQGCLEQQGRGDGLDAQAALFELGKLRGLQGHPDEAVRVLNESLRRFPDGVLEPEVRMALVVQLTRARRFEEARLSAAQFEARYPEDPRRSAVQEIEAALELLR